ncbi:hypothetical protein GCM10009116_14480 [Brevundimonas basaltis]
MTLGAPVRVAAQTANSSYTPTVELKVCNNSGRNATVAISYVEVGAGRFINRGWYDVYNAACIDLVSTDNSNFYMYADATDGSNRSWAGNHTLCVQYPGPQHLLVGRRRHLPQRLRDPQFRADARR